MSVKMMCWIRAQNHMIHSWKAFFCFHWLSQWLCHACQLKAMIMLVWVVISNIKKTNMTDIGDSTYSLNDPLKFASCRGSNFWTSLSDVNTCVLHFHFQLAWAVAHQSYKDTYDVFLWEFVLSSEFCTDKPHWSKTEQKIFLYENLSLEHLSSLQRTKCYICFISCGF